jgi:RHH-type proline utilization regulon transcriptional repressor/proline dehydrogenase/delta 1-pyrroline-5-carboxylate dehydrogenase
MTREHTMETVKSFRNEPLLDFSEGHNRAAVSAALAAFDSELKSGRFKAAPIINGEVKAGGDGYTRTDPSDTRVAIGDVSFATIAQADEAVERCTAAFPGWRATSYTERANTLLRLAELLRNKHAFLTALIIREVGKPWREADADVAEAIDFCRYYALEMLRLGTPKLTEQVLGEENLYLYQPRGVAVVISPWNFPLAITCGMAVAALVAGNTVVLKPAEQASIIAHEFASLVLEAGFPPATFACLPARGEDVGRHLVSHPHVAMIAFTGSRAVGLEIMRTAATVVPGQPTIKRVIAELGGKNALIVDDDADFDDAIRGVVSSAFGYAGQKCSACSRLIVVGDAYEPFLERLAAATNDIIIGAASDPASFLGPVIDEEARDRIAATIQRGREDLTLLTQASVSDELLAQGTFVRPTIFRDVPTIHPIWIDEIFGPVLACARAKSFEEALSMATASEYALTGGVFSRHPRHIAVAREQFRVGNLYINRGITGALVGRQPFGGFHFSGIGSKAGGPDYLLQFMEPRVITENTTRRGFSPDM